MLARGAISQYPLAGEPDPFGQKALGALLMGAGAFAADCSVVTVRIVMIGTGTLTGEITSTFLQLVGTPTAPVVYALEVGLWAVSDRAGP